MKNKTPKSSLTIALLTLCAGGAEGATVWKDASNALASASWDTFTAVNATGEIAPTSSHGVAQASSGLLITSSDLGTAIIDSYNPSIGGLGSNPSTYYLHDGGATWSADLTLSSTVTFVRVSYSLLGFGGDGPSAFAAGPEITGATELNSGSYSGESNTVFFTDLQLAAGSSSINADFGDVLFPGFPGSFRSVDGVQVEVFNAAPVPEPSVALLGLIGALNLLRRKR